MLTARWSGCSGSCTLLVSHRIDSYDMSTLPWRCFDFCVVDRLDAMPWVQLVPKKHGSSLLRWSKDYIKKNASSLLLHVCFAAVALLFALEKPPIAWWMKCVCTMRFTNKLQGNHPVAPRWARACCSWGFEVLGSRKKNVNVWLSDGSWSEYTSFGG